MKNECERMDKLLSAYLDNELDSKSAMKVKEHLSKCSHCSERLTTLKEIHGLLRARERMEPPPFLENRILSAAENIGLPQEVLPYSGWKLIPLFTAISILLLVFSFRDGDKDKEISPVDEYIYQSMAMDNNGFLLEESPITQDDMLNTFLDL
ncbi:unnamed protein product [marine sediment metagenome]|uniref:Putative zinc-finger domain-containing protein n=1 Tax=marine sediment metagenome TaxID=412755 RepID=X0SN67_9ZZZZ